MLGFFTLFSPVTRDKSIAVLFKKKTLKEICHCLKYPLTMIFSFVDAAYKDPALALDPSFDSVVKKSLLTKSHIK